jgi:hypothetical protein
MATFIGCAWVVTVLAALYAGYRWGARYKRAAQGLVVDLADRAKKV